MIKPAKVEDHHMEWSITKQIDFFEVAYTICFSNYWFYFLRDKLPSQNGHSKNH